MADQFTLDDLRDILINRIGVAPDDIRDDRDQTFEEIGLDSLAFIEIQLEMEQRYGFQVSEDDAQGLQTFGDAVDYVNSRLQEETV
jgi:acyl carrier protein